MLLNWDEIPWSHLNLWNNSRHSKRLDQAPHSSSQRVSFARLHDESQLYVIIIASKLFCIYTSRSTMTGCWCHANIGRIKYYIIWKSREIISGSLRIVQVVHMVVHMVVHTDSDLMRKWAHAQRSGVSTSRSVLVRNWGIIESFHYAWWAFSPNFCFHTLHPRNIMLSFGVK